MQIAVARVKGGELENRICEGVEKEVEVLQAVEELKKKGPQRLINGLLEWEEEDGLVYYKGKLYIPGDKGLRTDVLKQCYDAPTVGHLGEHRTLEQVHVLLMVTTLDAKGVADIHYQEIFCLHSIPHGFVSDRGPQFAAQVMHALYKHLGIQAGFTTAYHPSANGQTEQANQKIEQFLYLFISKHQDDWADWLPTAEFILNSRVHTAYDKSPFEVVYGY
uniref:Putative DNA/RNA polymerase n=1 Tax=Moniliophthora roreri TaxID=221103 RepID=A0A0W0FYW7_MONRR